MTIENKLCIEFTVLQMYNVKKILDSTKKILVRSKAFAVLCSDG